MIHDASANIGMKEEGSLNHINITFHKSSDMTLPESGNIHIKEEASLNDKIGPHIQNANSETPNGSINLSNENDFISENQIPASPTTEIRENETAYVCAKCGNYGSYTNSMRDTESEGEPASKRKRRYSPDSFNTRPAISPQSNGKVLPSTTAPPLPTNHDLSPLSTIFNGPRSSQHSASMENSSDASPSNEKPGFSDNSGSRDPLLPHHSPGMFQGTFYNDCSVMAARAGFQIGTEKGNGFLLAVVLNELARLNKMVSTLQGGSYTSQVHKCLPSPIDTLQEYVILTENLNNQEFKEKLILQLTTVGGENLHKTCVRMINMLLSTKMQTKFNRTGRADPRGDRRTQRMGFAPVLETLIKLAIRRLHQNASDSEIESRVQRHFKDATKRWKRKSTRREQ